MARGHVHRKAEEIERRAAAAAVVRGKLVDLAIAAPSHVSAGADVTFVRVNGRDWLVSLIEVPEP